MRAFVFSYAHRFRFARLILTCCLGFGIWLLIASMRFESVVCLTCLLCLLLVLVVWAKFVVLWLFIGLV